eukprot:gene12865-14190_t
MQSFHGNRRHSAVTMRPKKGFATNGVKQILSSRATSNRPKRHRVTINVSGERYQTYLETLERFPKTLLGDVERREQYYEPEEREYFFDRDRNAFAAIIYFYQSEGQLYCPLTVPLHILVSEAKFFDLGEEALNQVFDIEDSNSVQLPKNKLQREIWKLFDIPESGLAANVLTVFSVLIIVCSVVILCIETLPYFKGYDLTEQNFPKFPAGARPDMGPRKPLHHLRWPNVSQSMPMQQDLPPGSTDAPRVGGGSGWKKTFDLCETGIVAWFTMEFIVRFLSCPDKIAFVKSCMNLVDFLAIVPYYITLIYHQQGYGLDNIRIIRLVRVFRIFKLSRHSRGLQILGLTLRASIKELGLLIFFLLIGVVLFSSAVYYVEVQTFQSIPHAFWWAIITMCTVGYGDIVPLTFLGKFVGSLCAICGVLTIALPVPVIVSNFDYFYQRERARKSHLVFRDGCKKSEKSDAATTTTTPATTDTEESTIKSSKFKREQQIERQKTLKKLEKCHIRQSRNWVQILFGDSKKPLVEAQKEQFVVTEMESVV